MSPHQDKLAESLRGAIREHLQSAPAARAFAIELARWIIAEFDRAPSDQHTSTAAAPDRASLSAAPETAPVTPAPPAPAPPQINLEMPLRIGAAETTVEVPADPDFVLRSDPEPEPDFDQTEPSHDASAWSRAPRDLDLALLIRRARLKAESCRNFIRRRAAADDDAAHQSLIADMHELIDEARALPDCFLWVFWRHEEQPDDAALNAIADCYEALADAADLLRRHDAGDLRLTGSDVAAAFADFAEATSALRVALEPTWLRSPDRDQEDAHLWLRRETLGRQIFIERHMKLDDPADPARARELRERVAALSRSARERAARSKNIDSLFNRARYHARQLADDPAREHDRTRVNDALAELEQLGVPASDPRCAELRRALRDTAAADPAAFHRFLHPIPENAAPAPANDETTAPRVWSDRVREARALLSGGVIVIIGGEPRQEAIARIQEAFDAEVNWVHLTEHGAGAPMRAPIHRPETRLVIVLIRFAGHLHAEEARQHAADANKPCVLLPAGYNPEQIAEHVMTQAADRLGINHTTTPETEPAAVCD